jgi:crotonobetainyl-CoA:carnitine CoA-transferase CaiB-like acyl-CoA transferase
MLTGTKVLALSRVLAGPLCTMILGDMGADVIKVERPDGGDETRGWGPPFGADVVVENFLPGTLERRGWGPTVARGERPKLVWCSITGFGPGSRRPGYDFVIQAESGWMSVTGEPDGAPMKHGVALADVLAGKDAAIAILAALMARLRGSDGRHLEVSLAASAEAALVNVAQNTLVSGRAPVRWGNAHANLVPYQLFDADRPLVVAVGSDAQWRACVAALGLPELGADDALATNWGRLAQRERIVSGMAGRLATEPAAHWLARLEEAGVPCGIVRAVPAVLARLPGSARTGLPPSVPGSVRFPPPRLGEHSALVRAEGWNAFTSVRDRSS